MKKVFIPSWTKKQFIDWANNRFNRSHNHMKKNQLIAIFINTI